MGSSALPRGEEPHSVSLARARRFRGAKEVEPRQLHGGGEYGGNVGESGDEKKMCWSEL